MVGNWFSGEANQEEATKKYNLKDIFDDTEVLGLKGRDKMAIIVKIQAVFRGVLTRRRVK